MFRVTDLKQYAYCPRIVYYTYIMPSVRPKTFKMDEGKAAHRARGEHCPACRVSSLPRCPRAARSRPAPGGGRSR